MTGPSALAALGADVEWTDSVAATAARRRIGPGRGRLGEVAEWLAACTGSAAPSAPARVRALVLAPEEHLADPALAAVADRHGVTICRIGASGPPAEAFEQGVQLADREVDAGTDLVVLAAAGIDPPLALASLLLGVEPVALLPRGVEAVDTQGWIGRANRLREDRRRLAPVRSDPDALLERLASPAFSTAVALLMRAVARRTPVVLDGSVAMAAALMCYDTQPRAGRWWRVADTGADPVHSRVLAEFAQVPLLDLGSTRGDGLAGVLTVPLLAGASALTGEVHDD